MQHPAKTHLTGEREALVSDKIPSSPVQFNKFITATPTVERSLFAIGMLRPTSISSAHTVRIVRQTEKNVQECRWVHACMRSLGVYETKRKAKTHTRTIGTFGVGNNSDPIVTITSSLRPATHRQRISINARRLPDESEREREREKKNISQNECLKGGPQCAPNTAKE